MPAGRPKIYTPLQTKQRKLLHNVWYRCNYPGTHKFKYYGGAGVKCLITLEDIEFLWQRDLANELTQPSLDRIDPTNDYTLSNCRFIEFAKNRVNRRFKQCASCNRKILLLSREERCFWCRSTDRKCRCGSIFHPTKARQRRCETCDYITAPCVHCGKPITRPNIAKHTRKLPRWSCCRLGRPVYPRIAERRTTASSQHSPSTGASAPGASLPVPASVGSLSR